MKKDVERLRCFCHVEFSGPLGRGQNALFTQWVPGRDLMTREPAAITQRQRGHSDGNDPDKRLHAE
jgi:hypothetical protein